MGLAILGSALIGWGVWLRQKGKAERHRKLRDACYRARRHLVRRLLQLRSCSTSGNYLHAWDTFHYYAGSKYFKELSYDRLYECIAVADSEEPGCVAGSSCAR